MINIINDKIPFRSNSDCPCCFKKATQIIDLPKYPITEFFTNDIQKKKVWGFYDQKILFCQSCQHLFLNNILDPKYIYNNYLTSSSASQGAVNCLLNFKNFIDKNINYKEKTHRTIIDIGGNDSTFLEFFINKFDNLYNIDINASSKNNKIKSVVSDWKDIDFSNFDINKPIIYCSSHTIEHLEHPEDFIEKISISMNSDDLFFLQFPSLELLVNDSRFDQICHQHLNLFSLKSIQILLNKHSLFIYSFNFDPSHFGTLRLALKKNKTRNKKEILDININLIKSSYDFFNSFYKIMNDQYASLLYRGQGFGAGLMVPTLSYSLPLINNLNIICDHNESKYNSRYINLLPVIRPDNYLNKDKPVIITAISSKFAARSIFNFLSNKGIQDIIIPLPKL